MIWDRTTVPDEAVALVVAFEAFHAASYDDGYGFWTIGYGARRDAAGRPVARATPPVTEEQARAMLRRDLGIAVRRVTRGVTVPLTLRQAGALISLAYNLGDLKSAAPTLVARVNDGPGYPAAEAFGLYIRSAGRPSLDLRRRRWAEAAFFLGADPAAAMRAAWGAIHTVADWPPLPGVPVTAAPRAEASAEDLNARELARLRRGESRHG